MRSSKALSSRGRAAAAILACSLAAAPLGCSADVPAGPPSASEAAKPLAAATKKPSLHEISDEVRASMSDGAAYMRGEAAKVEAESRATGERRTVVLYVGAPWCEPCRHFHDALKRGDLDKELPGFVFFELDHDKDEVMLQAMGCTSKLIPLFAVPDEQGNCSDRRTEGGIKGDGAVAYMTPKIKALEAR